MSEPTGTQKGPHTQHHVHVFQPSDSQAEGKNKDIIWSFKATVKIWGPGQNGLGHLASLKIYCELIKQIVIQGQTLKMRNEQS